MTVPLIIATTADQLGAMSDLPPAMERDSPFPEIDFIASRLVPGEGAVSLTGDHLLRKVDIVSSGYPTYGRGAIIGSGVTIRLSKSEQLAQNQIVLQDSRWGAIIDIAGAGTIAADGFVLESGPSQGVLLIPLLSSTFDKVYDVAATVNGDSAVASLAVAGPEIFGELKVKTREKAVGYKLRITFRIDEFYETARVLDSKDSDVFTMQSQLSRPTLLVTHPRVLSPLLVSSFLNRARIASGAIIGGFGKGVFKMELELKMPWFRNRIFDSESISE